MNCGETSSRRKEEEMHRLALELVRVAKDDVARGGGRRLHVEEEAVYGETNLVKD